MTESNLDQYLQAAFPLFLILIATLAAVMLAWGGLQYIFTTVPGAKEEARKRIKSALLGLALALLAIVLLETINPLITRTKIFNLGQ